MPKSLSVIIGVASVLTTLATTSVAQTLPADLPLGIVCWSEKSKTWIVGYLHSASENGAATYRGLHTATVNADRVVAMPSGRTAVLDCYGKTLDQLRAMGRLIPFQRMPAGP
jgi:hypothetical protein